MSNTNTPIKSSTNAPRAASPSTTNARSTASLAPSPSPLPRPMPPVDHTNPLPTWNALPSAAARAMSFPPGSFDNLFLRLQDDFTRLSAEEARVNAQNQHLSVQEHKLKAAERKARKERDGVARELEKADRSKKVAEAQYDAAVRQEVENRAVHFELERVKKDLRSREVEVEAREREVERREKLIHRKAGGVLDVDVGAVGFAGEIEQFTGVHDGLARSGSGAGAGMAKHEGVPGAMSEALDDEPPRGRILTSPSHQQYDDLSDTTTPSSPRHMHAFHAAEISPLRRREVIPRRVSSANMSCATPTPVRMRPEFDKRASVSTGVEAGSVYESAEEDVAREGDGVQDASVVQLGRPRGRSVRRVSRHENLRR